MLSVIYAKHILTLSDSHIKLRAGHTNNKTDNNNKNNNNNADNQNSNNNQNAVDIVNHEASK